MASFGEALQQALADLSKALLAAQDDLLEEVTDASKAVEQLTQGKVKLKLALNQENENGVVLSLMMYNDQGLNQEITAFRIGLGGYPIISAPSVMFPLTNSTPPESIKIPTREGIKQFFNQLASDRNSPLVRKLAFVLRKN
jgi:hypothetical protein